MSPKQSKSRICAVVAIMAVFSVFLAFSAAAGDFKSSGVGTGSWDDPNSWTPPGTPGFGDNVTIQVGHVIRVKGGRLIDKLEIFPGGGLVGDKDVVLTVKTTVTLHPGSFLYGADFKGDERGGDVKITCGGQFDNHGVILAGDSAGASNENRPNPAEGKKGRKGGDVKITSGTGILIGKTGIIQGGDGSKGGSFGKTPNGGDGGKCKVKGKKVINDGGIVGGAGGDGQATTPKGHGGEGGKADVPGKTDNNGAILGGNGGKAPTGMKPGKGGPASANGTKNTGQIQGGRGGDGKYADVNITGGSGVSMFGANASVTGGEIIIQAAASVLMLSGLADGAIQATEGRVVLLSPGTLDVQGNLRSFSPKIVAKTGILVLASTVLEGFRGQFIGMCSSAPTVNRRAEFLAEAGPRVGTTYSMVLYSSADAGRAYYCLCALSAAIGVALDGFGSLQLDADVLFALSAMNVYPFVNFSGTLDAFGQGSPSVAIPAVPQLVGLDLYFQALMVQGMNLTNMTLAKQVKISP